MRRPRSPSSSMTSPGGQLARHRVDEDGAGVLAARLVLPPPAHDVGQHSLRRGTVPGLQPEARRHHDLVIDQIGPSEAQAQRARRHLTILAAAQVEHADPQQGGRDVGAVPARVHAHAAPHRARHPDRPLQPGEPGGHRAAGEDRQAHRAAGHHDAPVDIDVQARTGRARRPARGSRRRSPAGSSPARRRAPGRRTPGPRGGRGRGRPPRPHGSAAPRSRPPGRW